MSAESEPLTPFARGGISVVLAIAAFWAVAWVALTTLRVLGPFNYERFAAAIVIGVVASVATLSACHFSKWNRAIVSADRSTFTRIAAWVSIIFALDSLIVEPYIVRYFFSRFGYDDTLRWQSQLIVAGLLALAVAISKRSWRWVPFSVVATAFGSFWLLSIFLGD